MPIGSHVYKNGRTMAEAVEGTIKRGTEHDIKFSCIQLFAIGPRNDNENLTAEDKKALKKLTINKYIHGSYFDNPWGSKAEFGKHQIRKEFAVAEEIGATGIV